MGRGGEGGEMKEIGRGEEWRCTVSKLQGTNVMVPHHCLLSRFFTFRSHSFSPLALSRTHIQGSQSRLYQFMDGCCSVLDKESVREERRKRELE